WARAWGSRGPCGWWCQGLARAARSRYGSLVFRLHLEWIAWVSLVGCGSTPTVSPASSRPAPATPAAAAAPVPAEVAPPPVAAAAEPSPPPMPNAADAGSCPATDDRAVGILVSPLRPAVGQPVRV